MHSHPLQFDDDQPQVIVVGKEPQPQTIELGGMVEGVACRYEFLIRNAANVDIRDLSTRVSCGCLRATELEGKTLAANSELSFKATVLPTSSTYNQKLSLGGVAVDGVRKEIAVAHFTGKVAAPLDSNPKSISISDLKSGPVRVKFVSQGGINFDLKKAVLLDDRFRLDASDRDEITISTQLPTIAEQVLLIQIPFRIRETDFQHTVRIEVVDTLLKVAPASLILSEQNGHYVGRFIVQSKVEKILEKVEVAIEAWEVGSDSAKLEAEFTHRQSQSTKIFQFKLPVMGEGKVPKFRIVVRALDGDELFEKVIECLIP